MVGGGLCPSHIPAEFLGGLCPSNPLLKSVKLAASGGQFHLRVSGLVFVVICSCFLFWGPIQKDARRKNINFGGTQTSRSFTRTPLVTKTMDGLNPRSVNPIS